MRSFIISLILTSVIFGADTEDIFLGRFDRGRLRGERVAVSGFVNATAREGSPYKITAYRWLGSIKVIFILNFSDKFAPFAKRKRVLDPIRVSCVMVSDFEYSECYF
ncbi:MAG: hypothetical protein LBI57_06765 [Helicobacteraceae bacterium]|nr:hypothetical protein [Helicobacteraceae bacterium]